MAYHILMASRETFAVSMEKGVYGATASTRPATDAEIIASLCAIRPQDFVFFYVKNEGIYGLWTVTHGPFYDERPLYSDPERSFPYRICFEPTIRHFAKPVALNDILDLRDKGKMWTFDLGAVTRKNHYPITSQEGEEIIRLLLRNNPLHTPPGKIPSPYPVVQSRSLPLTLDSHAQGHLRYEGALTAWFTRCFTQGKLRDLVGDYRDVLNYVPTSFNTVMDLFLTHVTTLDSVDILHKFTCMELKTGTVKENDLHQIIRYENWLIRKLADGDSDMIQPILVGFEFDGKVLDYARKRQSIEEKSIRLMKYAVNEDHTDLILDEL